MVPLTVPTANPDGLAVTVSVEGVFPLVGLTVSHAVLVCALKNAPLGALETVTV